MAEEEEKKEPDEKEEDSSKSDSDDESNAVEEAKETVKELKEQNKILEKNLDRAEKLEAENVISGRAAGGRKTKKEETPKEYADRVMRGDIETTG